MDQKRLFIEDYHRGAFSMAELCRRTYHALDRRLRPFEA